MTKSSGLHKYSIIYADPPWQFKVWSRDTGLGRSAESHYSTMPLEEIKALPVNVLANTDCALFLWATCPMLPEALEVIHSWGFQYKTKAFSWVKMNATGFGLFTGMGYWTRANTEDCLLATKGSPRRKDSSISQIIMSPILEHSHKPAIVRERIVELMGDLPRIELFARYKVEGWDAWGNEVENDIDMYGIQEMV